MNNHTVLVFAYAYPPSRYFEIAGQRPFQFAKHLPDFGWNVIVVTRFWDHRIGDSQAAIPQGMPDPPTWDVDRAAESALAEANATGRAVIQVPFRETRLRRIYYDSVQRAKRSRFWLPYRKAIAPFWYASVNWTGTNWLVPASSVGERLCAGGRMDAILVTSPPADTLALGDRLSSRHHLPWIADLRDPASQYYHHPSTRRRYIAKLAAQIRRAHSVFEVTEELCDLEHAELNLDSRPYMIANGFDRDEYSGVKTMETDHCEIAYTGTIYPERQNLPAFLEGFRLFLNSNAQAKSEVRFRYQGTSSRYVEKTVSDHDLEQWFINDGVVIRDEAIRTQLQSSVLLLLTECMGGKGIATGKIYEYFAAGKPILAVPGDGSVVDRMIAETRTGFVAVTPEQIASTLGKVYEHWKTGKGERPNRNEAAVSMYERRSQARSVARILDRLVGSERRD